MKTATTIAKIADTLKRAEVASDTVNQARTLADEARQRRDIAALVMIAPFTKAVEAANTMTEKAKDAYYGYYTVGDRYYSAASRKHTRDKAAAKYGKPVVFHEPTIDNDEYQARLAAARQRRERDLARHQVAVFPNDVYTTADISRSLFVRIMARNPQELPEMPDADQVAAHAAVEVAKYDQRINEILPIRDEAIDELIHGEYEGPRVTNAQLSRLAGVTTARACQMRKGTR